MLRKRAAPKVEIYLHKTLRYLRNAPTLTLLHHLRAAEALAEAQAVT